MFLAKTPNFVQNLFPALTWSKTDSSPSLYLTFDDGPIPHITPWVLEQLEKYEANATFFCVGDNVRKYPHIFQQVVDSGHSVGHHTFNHLNGWSTRTHSYIDNTLKSTKYIDSNLFRPPYGRIRIKQAKRILQNFDIIMWDVLSGDFDQNLTPQQCFENVTENSHSGSIIVFHDSHKAFKNLKELLPRTLEYYYDLGFDFKSIPQTTQVVSQLKSIA